MPDNYNSEECVAELHTRSVVAPAVRDGWRPSARGSIPMTPVSQAASAWYTSSFHDLKLFEHESPLRSLRRYEKSGSCCGDSAVHYMQNLEMWLSWRVINMNFENCASTSLTITSLWILQFILFFQWHQVAPMSMHPSTTCLRRKILRLHGKFRGLLSV